MTLVVLAHPLDHAARHLVAQWRDHGARLMLPRDLSSAGWRFYLGGRGEGWCVAEGERIPTARLRGVLTRLPAVREPSLPHLQEGDRAYAAAEMNAFLIAWLSSLSCPVLNRPSAASMLGPGLSRERWLALAARAGLSLAQHRWAGGEAVELPPAGRTVSVVGQRWFGDVAPALGAQALALARVAQVQMVGVQFAGPDSDAAFLGADLCVDVERADVRDALLGHLLEKVAA